MVHPKIGYVPRAARARGGLLRLLACGALLGTALSGFAGSAAAADYTWTGGDGNYISPGNWNPGGIVGFADTAFFGASGFRDIDVTSALVGGWTFNAGAQAYRFTHTGNLLQFEGAGIVVVGGSATIVNGAASDLEFHNSSSAGSAFIDNDGDVIFDDSSSAGNAEITNNDTVTFVGTSNAGSAWLINNAGTINFSGTSFNGGQLTAGSIEGAGNYVLGSNELTVGSRNLATIVSGDISGIGGSLVKVGTGTLTFDGTAKTYGGGTSVNAGMLVVNTTLQNSGVTVGSGGKLGGNGTINGTAIINGVIAPGNSIGTITTGAITFGVGSRYEVEISPTQSDRTNVNGTATLAGTVQVIAESGAYTPGFVYTFLTSTGGRSGTFSSITDNLAFFTPVLSYDGNNVYLTLVVAPGAFQAFGTTSNRLALGVALDAMASPPYFAQLQSLTEADVAAALDALSGEAHAAVKGVFIEQSQMLADAALDRIGQAFDALEGAGAVSGYVAADTGIEAKAGTELWGNLYGSVGVIRATGNAAETTSATGGVLLGHDVELDSGWTAGVLAGAGLTAINARNTSANSGDFSLGVYGGSDLGIVDVRLGAAYTRHQISSRRTIAFPGVNEVMNANYAANTFQGFTEISRTFDYGAVELTPFGRLDLVTHATDAFAETGGAGALSSAASRSNAAFTTLGVRVADSFVAKETMLVRAAGSLGWRHAFADLPSTTNSFAGGTPFTVTGAPIASDALVVSGQLAFDVSESLDLTLSYDGQLSTAGAAHALKLAAAGTF